MLLETNRLLLCRYRSDFFNDYCANVMNDDDLAYMMKTAPIHTLEDARFCFDWKLNHKSERWYALCLKSENNKVIGGITIHPVPELICCHPVLLNKKGVSLSFSISRFYRRKGLMEEAVRALIDHLLYTEGVDYINSGYMDYNEPSRLMHDKLGFTYLLTDRFEEDGVTLTAIENILWRT